MVKFHIIGPRKAGNMLGDLLDQWLEAPPNPARSPRPTPTPTSNTARSPRSPRPPRPPKPPKTPTPPTSRNSPTREIADALRAHNNARCAAQGVRRPDLVWDDQLAACALRWAKHLASKGLFQHDPQILGQGENLYCQNGYGRQTFSAAVDDWVGEKKDYHGQAIGEGRMDRYGHYTQIIWPSNTHVGMASATGRDGTQVIVARYSPGGNMIGRNAYIG